MPPPARKRGQSGTAGGELHSYYSAQYGDRWPQLLQALAAPTSHVALLNPWVPDHDPHAVLTPFVSTAACALHRLARPTPSGSYPPPPPSGDLQLKSYYWLDFASAMPPLLLAPLPGHAVLDMCAAPGGKSLLLAAQLFATRHPPTPAAPAPSPPAPPTASPPPATTTDSTPASATRPAPTGGPSDAAADPAGAPPPAAAPHPPEWAALTGRLVCNEVDPQRRQRLERVLREYLPPEQLPRAAVTRHDGAVYWQRRECEQYDRVLLDAPCSSDRHHLQRCGARAPVPRSQWSLAACRKHAALQLKLLVGGLRALKAGGRLVYSTCAMAPLQNDDVVAAAVARCGGAVEVEADGSLAVAPEQLAAWGLERTRVGWICLPDRSGWGPIYVAVLRKSGSIDCSTAGLLGLQQLGAGEGGSSSSDEGEDGEGEEGEDRT